MTDKRETSPDARAFGGEIARLREQRRWTRPAFLRRIDDVLGAIDDQYEPRSDAWLHRLENGQIVKLPRPIINAICDALECSPRERAKLLLLADRNVLRDTPASIND